MTEFPVYTLPSVMATTHIHSPPMPAAPGPAPIDTGTSEPRVFIVVEQLVKGHLLQVRKEISQNMLMRGNFSGDVMLVEIAAALREVRGG